MSDTVTSDTVPAAKDEGTLDELSKQIEFAKTIRCAAKPQLNR